MNPDLKLKRLLDSLKFKFVKKVGTNGMSEVEISGNKDELERFNNWYIVGYEPTVDKILDYCEKYLSK